MFKMVFKVFFNIFSELIKSVIFTLLYSLGFALINSTFSMYNLLVVSLTANSSEIIMLIGNLCFLMH